MPNAFYSPEQAARVAASLVSKDFVLAGLIARDFEADFGGGSSDTVNVRIPGALPSRTRGIYDKTTAITLDEIAEQTVPVTLDEHAYSAVALSEGDMDLDLVDFAAQVLRPQTRAVAAHVERAVLATLQATPETTSITYDAANPAKMFTQVRKTLRSTGIADDAQIYAVAGLDVEAALLDGPEGTFDASGKVRGIEVHFSNRLAADEVVTFVRDAFALVVRAPKVPEGASFGQSVREEGFALRWIRDYDASVAADRSMVSAFLGVQPMPLPVVNEATGAVTLTANAGAVRVLTSTVPV